MDVLCQELCQLWCFDLGLSPSSAAAGLQVLLVKWLPGFLAVVLAEVPVLAQRS